MSYVYHLAYGLGLLYGLAGLYAAERAEGELREQLGWGKHTIRVMCMMSWPVLVMGLLTEGEKRP